VFAKYLSNVHIKLFLLLKTKVRTPLKGQVEGNPESLSKRAARYQTIAPKSKSVTAEVWLLVS